MRTKVLTLHTSLAIAATLLFTACGEGDLHADGGHEHGDEHAHSAPNGGMLVELDDDVANAEILFDAATGTLTMFTLDGHAEKALRSSSETVVIEVDGHGDAKIKVALAAQANVLSKEAVGDSSKFVGQHDGLKGLEHFGASIEKVTLRGADYYNVTFHYPAEADEHGDDDEHDDGDDDDDDDDDGHSH